MIFIKILIDNGEDQLTYFRMGSLFLALIGVTIVHYPTLFIWSGVETSTELRSQLQSSFKINSKSSSYRYIWNLVGIFENVAIESLAIWGEQHIFAVEREKGN